MGTEPREPSPSDPRQPDLPPPKEDEAFDPFTEEGAAEGQVDGEERAAGLAAEAEEPDPEAALAAAAAAVSADAASPHRAGPYRGDRADRGHRGYRTQRKKSHPLKATSIPILATVGLLLMGFAIYGLLILLGMAATERPDATGMGKVMVFAAGPIAICLLAAAIVFYMQVQREKPGR